MRMAAVMENYCTRYRNGQHTVVLAELTSLGEGIRQHPVYEQSRDVAKEFVDRSYTNLQTLRDTLVNLGYQFLRPESVLVDATSADVEKLNSLERQWGELPVLVRTWYERIACVDFRQDETQLYASADEPNPVGSDVEGLGCNCVLVFLRLSECLELRERLFFEEGVETSVDVSNDEEFFLPLGGCASNNDPKGLWLPNRAFDGVLYNDGGGDVTFANEVRRAIECGGFPFWQAVSKKRRFHSPVGHVPNYQALLPILTNALRPV